MVRLLDASIEQMNGVSRTNGRMVYAPSLDELWHSTVPAGERLTPGTLCGLPEGAQRYLEHAIAPGTRLARAVRLRMHGEIRLKSWFPFTAEQVLSAQRGIIWMATVRMYGLPIRGFDRVIDGAGTMRWKLLGIVPFVSSSGPDISRSAIGRFEIESMWLPSMLCGLDVAWNAADSSQVVAKFARHDEPAELRFTTDEDGRVRSVKMRRWCNPDGGVFRYEDFGAIVEEEAAFGGFTIPRRLRSGWYFGTDRFESEGEFIRLTIDDATYR
jgi:Family of unknown function (DUF6544)